MNIYLKLFLSALAVWRICMLLSIESGPFDVFYKMRLKFKNKFLGNLLNCIQCLSIWIAIPFSLWIGKSFMGIVVVWLGLSSIVCIIEKRINIYE